MLEDYFQRPHVRAFFRANLLNPYLDEFVTYLKARGHATSTIQDYVGAVGRFGRWLHQTKRRPNLIDWKLLCRYLNYLRRSASRRYLVDGRAALRHLLHVLQARGELPVARPRTLTAVERIVEQFREHLRDTGGLAEATRQDQGRIARRFLLCRFGRGSLRFSSLRPRDVMTFVAACARRCKPKSARTIASSLRSFLRYLQFRGQCDECLVRAIPTIPCWRLAHLPRVMTKEQVRTFLACFDRSAPSGQRDYAMALSMLELGLRVKEVANLSLDDIDWRHATVRIWSSKCNSVRILPLPWRVGTAIADYLRDARPPSPARTVFVRHTVPVGIPLHPKLIREAMCRVYAKVEGCSHWGGTHVLRHTAATRMYQRGASLKAVADVLGHRHLDTTAIYTKVDLPRLSAVALPWPGVDS